MAEYKLLVIDTCGSESTLALAQTGDLPQLFTATLPARTAASDSLTAVSGLLAESAWRLNELSAIAVVNGPGSFTGVRVGVALAKGLAESVGIPVVPISRLTVLRNEAAAAVLDAGRGEFYFADSDGQALLTVSELLARLRKDATLVICEPKLMETLASANPVLAQQPLAQEAIPFAVVALDAGNAQDAADLDAFYLRRPDAEVAMLRARGQ